LIHIVITIELDEKKFIVLRASGRLTQADYEAAVPEIENALTLRGKPLRLMVRLEDFRGWHLRALWDELRFDARHHDDLGRIAVVGDARWQEWGTKLSKPFFGCERRYFDWDEMDRAKAWLSE
jgi:hypothetical protein